MKNISKLLVFGIFTFLGLNSCTKSDLIDGKTKKGQIKITATGNANGNLTFEGNCTNVTANYIPLDQSFPGLRSINITGTDGTRFIGLVLYWRGAYPSNPFFAFTDAAFSTDQFGVGQFTSDINNATTFYQTIDGGTGGCTITNYDQTNQTVSGTYQFTAKLKVNGIPTGQTASFSGSYTDIYITDYTDQNNLKGPCYNSTGSTLGSGSSGSGGGGGGGGGGSTSTITFINPTFTTMNITFNGQSKTAAPGSTAVFTGAANANATGTATTSGKTTSGTQVGLLLTWNISQAFPGNGNLNYTINVNPNYFFLKIKNQSSIGIQKVYVNYGLQSQTLDNISIPNNGTVYGLGYYQAFNNSNVRAESGSSYWFWNSSILNLPVTNNQSVTLTAN